MKQFLATAVSIILHPVFIPSLGLLMLLNSGTYLEFLSYRQQRSIFIIFFTGTALLPLSLIPLMMLRRLISDIRMDRRSERIFPFMITAVFYGFTWYLLARVNVPGLITSYAMAAAISVLLVALLSIKWMISLHMMAMGALAGMLIATAFRFNINLTLFLTLAFLGGGLAGWARLSLKAHTAGEIYSGYILGFIVVFFIMYTF
jgi:membrane-associated phospholipid phosphatase